METKKRNWRMIRWNGLFDMLTNTDHPILIAIGWILIILTSLVFCHVTLYLTKMEDIVNYLDSSYEEVKELETQAIDLISSEYEKKINYNGTAYVTPLYKKRIASGYNYTLRYRQKSQYGTHEVQICIRTTKEGKVIDIWPNTTSKESFLLYATDILNHEAGIISAWIDLLIWIIVAIKKELMSQKTEIQTSKI